MSPDCDWKNFGWGKKKSPHPHGTEDRPPEIVSRDPYRFKKRGSILRQTLIQQHCHLKHNTFLRCVCQYVVHFASPLCLGCWTSTFIPAWFYSSYGFVILWKIKKFKVRTLAVLFLLVFGNLLRFRGKVLLVASPASSVCRSVGYVETQGCVVSF